MRLRGAEAPLFHGCARVLSVLRKIKINVKDVGPFGGAQGWRERPAHAGISRPDEPGPPDSRGRLSPREFLLTGRAVISATRNGQVDSN